MIAASVALGAAVGIVILLRWAVWRGFKAPRTKPTQTPADYGLHYRAARIPTVGGKTLSGWCMAADKTAPTVIVAHGWGANAALMLPLAAPLRRDGWTVVMFDARNHGESDEDNFSSMPRFAEDIAACLDWLRAETDLQPQAVAALGHSVGGAAALLAASQRADIDAVISLSAFDHPLRVMRRSLALVHIPYRPFGWLICRYVERIIGWRFDDIAPIATVGKIACPILVGHGALDDVVSPDAAREIAAKAPQGLCELAIIADTGHEAPVDYERVHQILRGFLERIAESRRRLEA